MEASERRELPYLSNVGLMLTYRCNIACAHCIVKAGPHRREEMDLSDAIEWLDQLQSYSGRRILGVSLTGGEPFYNQKLLRAVADHANHQGFIVSAVTNAYWASSKEEALTTLSRYDSIQMTSFSTDRSHQDEIPLSNIKHAIWAAKKLGKLYNVAISTESEEDTEYLELVDELLDATEPEYLQTSIIVPIGRAESEIDPRKFSYTSAAPKGACSVASCPIIFPNGNVSACVGPPIMMDSSNPLFLGNVKLESLHSILDRAEGNILLHAIRTFGPSILVDTLREHGFGDLVPDSFIKDCVCDVCYRLLSQESCCSALQQCTLDQAFREKVAYGRYYYLDERELVDRLASFDGTSTLSLPVVPTA